MNNACRLSHAAENSPLNGVVDHASRVGVEAQSSIRGDGNVAEVDVGAGRSIDQTVALDRHARSVMRDVVDVNGVAVRSGGYQKAVSPVGMSHGAHATVEDGARLSLCCCNGGPR